MAAHVRLNNEFTETGSSIRAPIVSMTSQLFFPNKVMTSGGAQMAQWGGEIPGDAFGVTSEKITERPRPREGSVTF